MDSKEDVSLSGFSSVSSDKKVETVDETNGLKSVDNNKVSSSNLNASSDDENEGFVSGQEEAFETNLDENLGETLAANVDEGDSFLETSEFPTSKVEFESETVSDEVVVDDDDDAEKSKLDLNLNSNSNEVVKDEVLEGGKGDKVSEETKEDEVDETKSKVVSSGEKVESGSSEVIVANGVKVNTEGDSIVEKVEIDTPAPGVVVVANTPVDEDDDEDEDEGVVLVGGPDNTNLTVVEAPELESNGGNDVKLTSEGDSVVEAIDVDLPVVGVPGVAVVTKKEEDGVDVAGGESGSSEKMDRVLEEVVDKEVVGVTTGGFSPLGVEDSVGFDAEKSGKNPEAEVEKEVDYEIKENGSVVTPTLDDVETVPTVDLQGDAAPVTEVLDKSVPDEVAPVAAESLDKSVPDEVAPVAAESLDKDVPDEVAPVAAESLDKDVPDKVAPVAAESLDKDLPNDGAQKTENLDKDLADDGVQKTEILDKDLADDEVQRTETLDKDLPNDGAQKTENLDKDLADDGAQGTEVLSKDIPDTGVVSAENGPTDKFVLEESAEKDDGDEEGYIDGSPSDDEETDGVIFGSSEAAKQFMEELERGEGGGSNTGGESSQDRSQMIDGQIVTDSDEDDDEEDGKELFDSAALAALLKAAADSGSEGGNITFSSQDGSRLFTVERPAGLGPSLQTMRPAPRPTRANIFNPSSLMTTAGETNSNLTEEEVKKLETLQSIRVKFLRLVQRLGLSPDESVAAQVLYRLALIAGRQTGQSFSLDAAKRKAMELETEGKDDLNFSVNILVIGKAGVGKSATINSIFGEEKTVISAFKPATSSVKEIRGMVGGVMIRVFDTPGLRSSVMDQGFNRSVLASAKRFTKKNPPDIVLYVDRLDAQTRDHNDIPLLKTITSSLGAAIWRSAIVTFTHGASAPPEGSNGVPLSYEMFVTQRSHVVQQAIGHAVGDLRMMSPSLMNPVSLVENHQNCRKNREGQKVLPNGQTWRPQLLMLCYSMKILAEANSLTKTQDPYDNRKLFGFRVRSPPLPYMLSSMLQSRAHPKLAAEQGGDGGDSDVDLADLSDSDDEDEDEYDQLPPFKPLKKTQLSKLSREQRKAYFDEYDYRVKLLQKKQWKEELKRMKEIKKRGKDGVSIQPFPEEDGGEDAPAPVAVPLPDMALPPSFDSDNPAYRFRFLEPTSQFLARPVLDTHGWDHDCGYDGVNLEQTLAVASRFPAAVSVQITKDKKDFSINMDSSVSVKHGENGSSMAGFDVQPIGKQLAYIVRGETKFKNLKKNKTAAGMSVTFLGENVVTGFKVEDQIAFGKQYSVIGSAGTVRFQTDSAYGANIEVQRRELDYPIGQVQSTIGVSIIKWRGDLALGFNSLAQFSAGRNSKVAVRAGINNKMSGQVTVKTSSSEHLSLALAAVLPSVISAYKKFWSSYGEKNSAY